jgi:hypothetical protein
VGAGLQISPNAARILGKLGVLDRLTAIWLEPQAIRLISGTTLRELASVPMGDTARNAGMRPTACCIAPACRMRFSTPFSRTRSAPCISASASKAAIIPGWRARRMC